MSHQPKHIYEFGSYHLNPAERLLRRDGEVVPLQPKILDLLLVLVERHGQLLEKDELMKLVWPDAIVEEANLANNISILRKTLGQNGERFIETVPKRGYRFVIGVKQIAQNGTDVGAQLLNTAAETDIEAAPIIAAKLPRRRWQNYRLGIGITLAVLIAALAAFYYWPGGRGATEMQIKTMAVLPPRPLQTMERDELLELGTTSTLITRLSSLRQLIVRPENAVSRYARPDQDPLAAGREQQVHTVLDSRYQRAGDRFRFTLRLLRVTDGATLWADTLDAPAADLFALEDALSTKVTGALRLTLSSAERELLAKRYTTSAEAWQLYVRGRQLVHKRRIPDIEKAITYFERAIALDQQFALAYVLLGFAHVSLNYLGHAPALEVMPKAKAAYDQALKLDNQLAEAHSLRAQYKHYYEWDRDAAEQLHRRALELNPNSADLHLHYALHLMHWGRSEQAIAEIGKAEKLDPTDVFILINVAQVLFFARRYDEAIEQAQRAIDLNPDSGTSYNWMIRAYEMKGDEQRAFAAILKRAEASRAGADEIAGMKAAFAADGLKAYWRRQLDRQLELEKSEYVAQYQVALLYARLGKRGQALARLPWAAADRNIYITALNVEPLWDSYRADLRFVALVQSVGLAP